MNALLFIGMGLFALLVLRFVQPTIVHRVREYVVRATINRLLLEATSSEGSLRQNFGTLLSLQLHPESASSSNAALELRCHKLREVMAVLTSGEHEGRAHESVGTGLVELADMVTVLGNRFRPGAEERETIVDAEQLLRLIVSNAAPASFASLPPDVEAVHMLRAVPLSIVQLGEMMIAIVFALISRETTGPAAQGQLISAALQANAASELPVLSTKAPGPEQATAQRVSFGWDDDRDSG